MNTKEKTKLNQYCFKFQHFFTHFIKNIENKNDLIFNKTKMYFKNEILFSNYSPAGKGHCSSDVPGISKLVIT